MFKHGRDNIGEKYTSRLRDVSRRALLEGFGGCPPPEKISLNGAIWGTSLDDPGLEILTNKIQFSEVFSQLRSLQYLAF